MNDDILKYNEFNESMMINKPNTEKSKSKKLDFRKFCSWDDISIKRSLSFSLEIRVYYSPIRNTIISIEPRDSFSANLKKFPFKRGDTKESVRDWIENNSKVKLTDSLIKRYRGKNHF